MTSVVIDNGGPALEFDSNEIKNQEENETVSEFPAVVVEPVPSARLEQGYAAQVLVYDDETYLMQDVAEEQEIETETVETGCSLETGTRLNALRSCDNSYHLSMDAPFRRGSEFLRLNNPSVGVSAPPSSVANDMSAFRAERVWLGFLV